MNGKCSAHFACRSRYRNGDDHKTPTCAIIQHSDKALHVIEDLCQCMNRLTRSPQQGVERAPQAQRGQYDQKVQYMAAEFFL